MATAERPRDVMTPSQAAAYLQVDRETVYRYIRDGQLLASKLGRTYRIPKESIDTLLWATRARPDILLRDYSPAEIREFLEDDRLEGTARGIARRFMEANTAD